MDAPAGGFQDPSRPPTGSELARAYGGMRGFKTFHGEPDESRAARVITKDYINGRLLYCHLPPTPTYEAWLARQRALSQAVAGAQAGAAGTDTKSQAHGTGEQAGAPPVTGPVIDQLGASTATTAAASAGAPAGVVPGTAAAIPVVGLGVGAKDLGLSLTACPPGWDSTVWSKLQTDLLEAQVVACRKVAASATDSSSHKPASEAKPAPTEQDVEFFGVGVGSNGGIGTGRYAEGSGARTTGRKGEANFTRIRHGPVGAAMPSGRRGAGPVPGSSGPGRRKQSRPAESRGVAAEAQGAGTGTGAGASAITPAPAAKGKEPEGHGPTGT